ncbi:MAG: hypothetical protein FH749_07845 [Firmicutes bacterium]|nr:hypothetical protein [Bacillota bacterium]
MNILDHVFAVLGMPDVVLGVLPDAPDGCIALFEYEPTPPVHYFGGMHITHGVQARCRDIDSASAYAKAEAVAAILGRYSDDVISSTQSTPILDIGQDEKKRREYTVNFTVRRY